MKQYLVLDLGGTQIKYGILNEEGVILNKGNIPSRVDSLEHLLEDMAEINNIVQAPYQAVAVSMPGRIDTDKGISCTGGSFKFLLNHNFQKDLEDIFSLPVTIANDAKCAAAGELWKGSMQGVENAAVLTIGTGLGGSIILNHQVYMGNTLNAGEFSLIPTNYEKVYDLDYSAFMFSHVSTSALVQYYAQKKNVDKKEVNGIQIFDAYESGEKEALESVNTLAKNVAIFIFTLQCVLDLEVYAIGGGISARSYLFKCIDRHMDELFEKINLSGISLNKPEVVPCAFKNDANLIGALYFHLKHSAV